MRRPCCDKQDTNKGEWSKQEDQKLIDYIRKHGEGCWRSLPQAAGLLRCRKSCRLRWINYLQPNIKQGNFGEDEEDLIIKLHALLGNRWSLIAGRLPGRTAYEIENHWNTHLKRKLISMGIDPDNHRVSQSIDLRRCQNPGSTSDWPGNHECKGHENLDSMAENDVVSDSTSCIGNNSRYTLPDLNLDLTISPPSSFPAV